MHLAALSSLFLGTIVVLGSPIIRRRDIEPDFDHCPDYCAGTSNGTDGSDSSAYVCGDKRLGPVVMPTEGPVKDLLTTYRYLGGLCPQHFLKKYTNRPNDTSLAKYEYPKDSGFTYDTPGAIANHTYTLETGTYVDRFGSERGTYLAPAGTPYAMRSLPPDNLITYDQSHPYNYYVYKVAIDFEVGAGPIAPYFGQPGLGLQFSLNSRVEQLVNEGKLLRVNLTTEKYWEYW
ncbi:hypothetical protein CGCA056_v005303 [Colletotrichum aenigma]|uniref:uncharacterized protein n=1 Tax=Colletotrichum aenigma TaxID=1215731 RepID=UPI0018729F22|nr:uncharacterized protein CGCA056_v005303 [Colletotrichum aenigma]KAF5524562.1 hypothetical protein CGCA056_v005303 [Colletotrichum aenigma]